MTIEASSSAPEPYGGGQSSTNLGDILTRVLDKGIVIAGDIRVNLLDIELLTIKLRLVIASLETAKTVGIDWWQSDPWLSGRAGEQAIDSRTEDLELENQRLRDRIAELESRRSRKSLESGRGRKAAEPSREPVKDSDDG